MSTPEHVKAKEWRERLGLSFDQLAELSGYAALSIRWFEKGRTAPRTAGKTADAYKSRKIDPFVWQRYKLVCAGVERQLKNGSKFDW